MKDCHSVLRKVGWVLIAIGVIDIGYMIYCISNHINYTSSFNIFAIIAGIFLLKGSLKAARTISWLMAFFITISIGVHILIFVLFRFDLLLTYIRLSPISILKSSIFPLVSLALLIWMYHELTSQTVRTAMEQAGVKYNSFWWRPDKGFWIGGCCSLILLVFLHLLLGGTSAKEAKQRAIAQFGDAYKYQVTSINISSDKNGKHVRAVLAAYNDTEIKNVVVEWSD